MDKPNISLTKDTVIDAKSFQHDLKTVETGVLTNINEIVSIDLEFTESGKYAVTVYGEPVDEPAYATIEAKVDDEMAGVFTVVGKEAKEGKGGVSRAFYVEKGTHTLTLRPTGGRGGLIIERVSLGKALVENPNSYKPSDNDEII